jgi:hypothetical protein
MKVKGMQRTLAALVAQVDWYQPRNLNGWSALPHSNVQTFCHRFIGKLFSPQSWMGSSPLLDEARNAPKECLILTHPTAKKRTIIQEGHHHVAVMFICFRYLPEHLKKCLR